MRTPAGMGTIERMWWAPRAQGSMPLMMAVRAGAQTGAFDQAFM